VSSGDLHHQRVLVTGGAGFIGGHLVDTLVASGASVIVLDDLSSGSRDHLPRGTQLIEADIADPSTVGHVAQTGADLVIHAAAQVSVPASVLDPARDRAVNLAGTEHVLEGARRAGASRFVFISSGGAVYGESDLADERTLPAPMNPYGIHKLAAESYVRTSGLSYGVVRFSNVYGPRQRAGLEGGVVAIFGEALSVDRPVTIYGDGSQVRDFLDVQDAVSGTLAIAAATSDGTWNVATAVATSIASLLALLEQATGRKAVIEHAPRRPGDVQTSSLSIDSIRRDLGWEPRRTVEAGVKSLVEDWSWPTGLGADGQKPI
jgi:UDP-glucose 4-epimerase